MRDSDDSDDGDENATIFASESSSHFQLRIIDIGMVNESQYEGKKLPVILLERNWHSDITSPCMIHE